MREKKKKRQISFYFFTIILTRYKNLIIYYNLKFRIYLIYVYLMREKKKRR